METSDLKESEIVSLVKKDKVQGLSSGELKRLKKAWKAYVHFRRHAKKHLRRGKFEFIFYSNEEAFGSKSYAYIGVSVPCSSTCDITEIENDVIALAKKYGLYKAGITANGAGYGGGERDVGFSQN